MTSDERARDERRLRMRALGARGGAATVARHGREHMRNLGRAGFAALVAAHYKGDRVAAGMALHRRGLMALDPVPTNGAWTPPEHVAAFRAGVLAASIRLIDLEVA